MRKTPLVLLALGAVLVSLVVGASCTPTPGTTATSNVTSSATQSGQPPVEVVGLVGPLPPINPGGPVVEITLKNIASEPIVSLNATLQLNSAFVFDFEVGPSMPLLPGSGISSLRTLIGGGFSDTSSYPLTIRGIFQGGVAFTIDQQVQIAANTFSDTLPLSAKSMTLEEAANTLGFPIPVPGYLPDGYSIQGVYVQEDLHSVSLLISDTTIGKYIVAQKNNPDIQQYEFQCRMTIGIRWGSEGIPGGLKLPGERPAVNMGEGSWVAAVIVASDTHNSLWLDWRPDSNLPAMYEIVISANKSISNEELVKIAESMGY